MEVLCFELYMCSLVIFSLITLISSAFPHKYKLEFRKQESHAGLEDVVSTEHVMANKSILKYVSRCFPTDVTV
jgi:hypothetical protein